MKMEEKDNPNSNSHDTSKYKSWSDLPLDLSSSILERLGFADFRRAKSVCSSWHAASKQSVPKKNQIHWLILFPKDNNSCTLLFNPEEKDNKLYKTRDLRFEESVCLATYGNWLLMTREYKYFYIVNLFTKEMINVPPYNDVSIQRSHVFWIDEKTKDYVVLFGRYRRHENLDVFYCSSKKKQDDDGNNNNLSWNQIPETSHCINLVYKDHKLYFLSLYGIFRIFDFSSSCENPKQIFACGCPVEKLRLGMPRPTRIVVSVRKDQELVIFKVEMFSRRRSKNWHFRVFKIYSSGFLKIPEMVDSLGDEAVLFDQGITVLAAANEGFIRRNSIYFSDRHDNIYVFSLETQKTELLHTFDFSSVQFSSARWFLPSFYSLNGNRILTSGGDNVHNVFDTRTLEICGTLRAPGNRLASNWSRSCISPDDDYVAAGSADGTVHVWSLSKCNIVSILKEQTSPILCCSWSGIGKPLASADKNGYVCNMDMIVK